MVLLLSFLSFSSSSSCFLPLLFLLPISFVLEKTGIESPIIIMSCKQLRFLTFIKNFWFWFWFLSCAYLNGTGNLIWVWFFKEEKPGFGEKNPKFYYLISSPPLLPLPFQNKKKTPLHKRNKEMDTTKAHIMIQGMNLFWKGF